MPSQNGMPSMTRDRMNCRSLGSFEKGSPKCSAVACCQVTIACLPANCELGAQKRAAHDLQSSGSACSNGAHTQHWCSRDNDAHRCQCCQHQPGAHARSLQLSKSNAPLGRHSTSLQQQMPITCAAHCCNCTRQPNITRPIPEPEQQ